MVDWSSPAEMDVLKAAIDELDAVIFGIMLWECLATSWFEIDSIFGRRAFRWPKFVYWGTKYITLIFTIFVFIISVSKTDEPTSDPPVNCQVLSYISTLSGKIAMAGASSLLMLRAIALWGRDIWVVVPISVLHAGQWAINLHNGFIVKELWEDIGGGKQGCKLLDLNWKWTQAQFIYAMLFDFIVLALALTALLRIPGRSNLWNLLFVDGLSYFLVAFAFYLTLTILAYIGISVTLVMMVSNVATVIVTSAACRSFVRVGTSKAFIATDLTGHDDPRTTPPDVESDLPGQDVKIHIPAIPHTSLAPTRLSTHTMSR